MAKIVIDTIEIKQIIIENFINDWTSSEKERDKMKQFASDYVDNDHVDEIAQALGLKTPDTQIEMYCPKCGQECLGYEDERKCLACGTMMRDK